jgi:hypothetical protein
VGAIAGWGRTNGFISTLSSVLRNVKVNVADETTNTGCSMFGSLKNSILCLGFCIFRLKLNNCSLFTDEINKFNFFLREILKRVAEIFNGTI